jgi:hypothetical protein
MSQPTAAEIEKLCDDWCAASITPEGGMAIGANTEKFRLLANGVQFHELGHEALCAALIGLSKVLLRPGLNTVVVQDHFALWSWCGELLLSPRSQLFTTAQREIKSLYEVSIHAALAGCRKPPETKEEWQEQNRIQELQPHHAKQLLRESSLVLGYLGFPLLEAVLKRACATYVAFDGQVISTFSVPNRQGNPRQYDPNGSFRDRQCSSLRDLLFLHSTVVAGPQLKAYVDRFRIYLTSLDGSQDPFDLLYGWRNQSLHGSTNFQTIGGIVLNISLLISLFEIEHDFEQHRLQTIEHCRWEAQSQCKSPWSFYPPY